MYYCPDPDCPIAGLNNNGKPYTTRSGLSKHANAYHKMSISNLIVIKYLTYISTKSKHETKI